MPPSDKTPAGAHGSLTHYTIYLDDSVRKDGRFMGCVSECLFCVRWRRVNVFDHEVGDVHEPSGTFPRQHFDQLFDVFWWFLIFGFVLTQVFPDSYHFLRERVGVFGQLQTINYFIFFFFKYFLLPESTHSRTLEFQ